MKELYVEKFKGENFRSWKLRLKSKMGLMSSDYNVLFNYFEQAKFDKPINDNDFKKTDGSLDQEKIGLSKALKAYNSMPLRLLDRRRSTSRLYGARFRTLAPSTGSLRSSLGLELNGKANQDSQYEVRREQSRGSIGLLGCRGL